MKIAITGGGTGGHLVIAKAVAEAANARGHETLFVGSLSGQDRMWFEDDPLFRTAYFLETTGVVNQRGAGKFRALWKIAKAWLQSRRLLKRHGIEAVVSVGGFSAAPASFAALSLGIPLFIHEQNAVTGRLNRLLRPFSKIFFSSYDAASPVKDYPVSAAVFGAARVRTRIGTVIFLGGSQGALFINDLALAVAPRLNERGIRIVHQCGERDYERVKNAYETAGIGAEVVAFSKKMPELLAGADLAVSRAGASTLWELCAAGIPAFFIPFPYAAADHQYHNARFLVEKGLGWCERQKEGLDAQLLEILDTDIEAKSRELMTLCRPDGAARIVEAVEKAV